HEVLGFARVAAARVLDGGDSIEVLAVHGLPAETCGWRQLSPALGPIFQAVTSKAPVLCGARTDGGRGIAVGDEPAFPRGAYLAVPLIVGDRVIGVTAADVGGGDAPLEPRVIEPFMLLCQQLAAGVREARLYAGAVAREREACAVRDVAAAVARATADVEMFEPAVARAADVLGVDAAFVHVMDAGTGQLTLAVHCDLPDETEAALATVSLGAGPIGRAAATGEAEAVESVTEPAHGLASMLVVPIGSRAQVLGTLTVASRVPRSFTLWEIQLLGAITHQLHVGLTNLRLVEDLKVHVERLEAKNAELDSFVYSVSHDLRSPLTTIQGMATVLREDHGAVLGEEGQHFLRRIEVNIAQMGRLIADVLALARIGREARAPEMVELDSLVDEIITELRGPVDARGVIIRRAGLGAVAGVRSQVRQVFVNLIGNAIKYLGAAPAPIVEISRREAGGVAEFVVADNGIGIDP
ncbi:MAG: GAF domain-containing protein, partial [Chloroflexi bacterium]|nr:GAF domain-containing protein [Chloroflexota bacterium]